MKNYARTFAIALIGATAGVGVALLFAPYSGEKTRLLIRFKVESCVKDLARDVNAKAASVYRSGSESTRRALKRLGNAIAA